MKAVVFAAGRGERLWPLTETRPKHLLNVANRPILEGTLKGIAKSGIHEIILVVSYKEEMIKAFVGDGGKFGCNVSFVKQNSPYGTADALRNCESVLEDESRFIVTYGDDYYSSSGLARFIRNAAKLHDFVIATAEVEDPSKFGKLEIRKNLVTSIHEKTAGKGPARVNAGLYMLNDSIWKSLETTKLSRRGEYELTDSISSLIDKGQRVLAFSLRRREWLGITYPWDLLEANRIILEDNPSSIRGKVEDGVRIKGTVGLSKGSVVKSGSYLEGPLLIDENCTIGPNSYLRPFTSIGKNCKVGANCEIKNSILMNHVKVPHLSYLGDSVLGEGSSLGAGTITANLRFDGQIIRSRIKGKWIESPTRKLGTVFGDCVRTGINVSILPGVKLGPGVWVGPGATVHEDVQSGRRVRE